MSGRSERERREAARARLSAAGITPTKTRTGGGGGRQGLVIAAVILLVAVVAGVFVYLSRPSSTGDAVAVAPTYTATRTGTVVAAGNPGARVTVDVYEDFLCPACQQVEGLYGNEITTALNEGKIKVNYHPVAILDRASEPQGYSTLAANAGLCAADARIWPRFHERLFTEQPAEGGPGKTAQELVAIGAQLGAQGDFASCVTANGDAAAIAQATTAAVGNAAVAPGGKFGTPTILLNGTKIDLNDPDWLSRAIAA